MWRLASTGLLILVSIPVGTIYRQNLEEWAKGRGLDRLLSEGTGMFVSNPWGLPLLALFLVLLGSTAALWLQYFFQRKFPNASLKKIKYVRDVEFDHEEKTERKNNDSIPASDPSDFDLVFRPDQPVVAHATQTEDGIDLLVRIVVRNRSKKPVWIKVIGRFPMVFDGKQSASLSGGGTNPIRPETNMASNLGDIRVYHGVAGRLGNGRISYLFGSNEESAKWVFDVDIDFKVLEDPKKTKVKESVPVELLENRSVYRPKTDEDQ